MKKHFVYEAKLTLTLIKVVAILEQGETTVFKHLSWTTKLHTEKKKKK